MIRIRDITLPLEHDKGALLYHAAQALHIRASEISSLQIFAARSTQEKSRS